MAEEQQSENLAAAEPGLTAAANEKPAVASNAAAAAKGTEGTKSAEKAQSAAAKKGKTGKKKPTKAQLRKRKKLINRGLRWVIQLVFLIMAPGVFSAAFNGAKYLLQRVGALQAIEVTSFVIILIGVCAYTIVFGRFFCGYACAFGTLGDAVHALFTPLRKLLAKKFGSWEIPARLRKVLRCSKIVVLAVILILSFKGVYESSWSPWTAFAGFTTGSLDGIQTISFVMLGLVVLGMALVDRFFCQFLCPLGAIFSFLPILPFSHFERDKGRCAKSCGQCRKGCSMHIYPDADSLEAGECICCGACSDVCPMNNVNVIAFKDGVDAQGKKKQRRIRGTHPAWVIVRAALLFVLCWAIGAVRFLPDFMTTIGALMGW